MEHKHKIIYSKGGVMEESSDHNSFKEFYKRHYRKVVSVILGIVYDHFVAEELAQELFLRLYRKKDRIDYSSDYMGKYLYRSAKNISIDYKRKNDRDKVRGEKYFMDNYFRNDYKYSEVEQSCLWDELSGTVNEVLDEFPSSESDIFIERVFNNRKVLEISDEVNLSSYKIKKIENEIRNRLKEKLITIVDPNIF